MLGKNPQESIDPGRCRSPKVSAVIEVSKLAGLESTERLIDTVAAGLCSHVELSMRPRAEPLPRWVHLWWTSHRSVFDWDGAGYRVVSGAHTSQGYHLGTHPVLANKSPVALILMGG
jgi:hypothetical protein